MPSEWRPPAGGTGRSTAFVLAHPDDEFFCLPVLAAEVRSGRPVQVVYLTDGGPLAERREQESRRVLGAVGVAAAAVCFAGHRFGWRDGALHRSLGAVRPWLAEQLAEWGGGCDRVYVPAYEGGHHDHDVTFSLVASLLGEGALPGTSGLQFPLYTGRALPGALFRCMAPIPENGECLELRLGPLEAMRWWRVAFAYPSQWRTWVALAPASLGPFLQRRSILLQRVEPSRVGAPPHPGIPYYQRRFRVPRAEVLRALGELRDPGAVGHPGGSRQDRPP